MSFNNRLVARSILVAVLCVPPIARANTDGNDESPYAKLGKRLDHQNAVVKSAVIHYRYVYRNANPNLSSDDVLRLINRANLVGDEPAQKKLITSLDATLAGQVTFGLRMFSR